jgi:hypothetical protein
MPGFGPPHIRRLRRALHQRHPAPPSCCEDPWSPPPPGQNTDADVTGMARTREEDPRRLCRACRAGLRLSGCSRRTSQASATQPAAAGPCSREARVRSSRGHAESPMTSASPTIWSSTPDRGLSGQLGALLAAGVDVRVTTTRACARVWRGLTQTGAATHAGRAPCHPRCARRHDPEVAMSWATVRIGVE